MTEPPSTNASPPVFCGGCGYDLHGLSSNRCPECGLTITADGGGAIPWERRADLGVVRSFLATLMLATFRPARLGLACGSPVDVRSARWFRRWVVLITWLSILLVIVLVFCTRSEKEIIDAIGSIDITPGGSNAFWEPALMWTAGAAIYPALPIGVLMTLLLGTGIAHWFYVPGLPVVRQNRAMVISYYQCAPLALLPVPALAVAALLVLTAHNEQPDGPWDTVAMIAGFTVSLSGLFILLALWIVPVRALQKSTQCSLGRLIFVGFGLQLQGALAIVIGLGIFPAIVGFVWLMIDSLRQ